MIGRGERYPLVRHVTEDETRPRPVCFGLGDVSFSWSAFGSTDDSFDSKPRVARHSRSSWRLPWATVSNAYGELIDTSQAKRGLRSASAMLAASLAVCGGVFLALRRGCGHGGRVRTGLIRRCSSVAATGQRQDNTQSQRKPCRSFHDCLLPDA